jgi:hypothetical protein
LTPEDQEYYELYLDLFTTKGWKQFQTEIQEIFDSYRIEDIKDETELHRVLGERNILQRLLIFEDGIKTNYEVNLESFDAQTI